MSVRIERTTENFFALRSVKKSNECDGHEERMLGLIAKHKDFRFGYRADDGIPTPAKGTTIPKPPAPPKPRRPRMTWEQERERRRQRRQQLTLAKLAAKPKPNPEAIVAECCAEVGVDPAIVLSDARIPWMCMARWRVWQAMRDRGMRVTAVANAVGRDHSSISHGLRLLREHMNKAITSNPG